MNNELQPENVHKITRTQAAMEAVNSLARGKEGRVNREELISAVENMVVSSGGKPNRISSERALKKVLKTAEDLGVIIQITHVDVEYIT